MVLVTVGKLSSCEKVSPGAAEAGGQVLNSDQHHPVELPVAMVVLPHTVQ